MIARWIQRIGFGGATKRRIGSARCFKLYEGMSKHQNRLFPNAYTARLTALACLVGAALSGCGGTSKASELSFSAGFGEQAFSCSSEASGVGAEPATARAMDLRFYVHDVQFTDSKGKRHAVELIEDGEWQRDGVALIDLEDGTGSCNTGSPATNSKIRYVTNFTPDKNTTLSFKLGVPVAQNHLDAATAPPPFNAPGMWWSWQGGFKYMKADLSTRDNEQGFFFHLGGTTCDGTPASGFKCAHDNLATIELKGFGAGASVHLDLAALYSRVNINQQATPPTDFVAGCMAFSGDPECAPMFSAIGLGFEGGTVAQAQSLFSLRGSR